MSATVRICAYDGARYLMSESCPQCGARHSTADLALERMRTAAAENQRERATSAPLAPLPAQLDLDGHAHEIAPETERLRLFEPAPTQLPGQSYLALDAEEPSA